MNLDEKNYEDNVGKRVTKKRANRSGQPRQPKPFKSGLHVNTVKAIVEHPILKIPAYTFEEDESYVECRHCYVVEETQSL